MRLCRCPSASRPSAQGWALVSCIVLLSSVILMLVGITFFVTEHLRSTSLAQNATRAVYLAQAGIMRAIYDIRQTSGGVGFQLGEYRVDTDAFGPIGSFPNNDVYILGGQGADFLLATMIPGTFATGAESGCGSTSRHRLNTWRLRNVLLSATPPAGLPLTITQMTMSWFPNSATGGSGVVAGEGFVSIYFNGTGSKDWPASGCVVQPSGTTVTLSPSQTIPANTEWPTNRIVFATTNMTTKQWIELAFVVTDGVTTSTRRARCVPSGTSCDPALTSASFTIKSAGVVRQGAFPFSVWRRVQAEYRVNEAAPTNLQAIGRLETDPGLVLSPAAPAADQRPGYQELSQQTL